MPILAVPARTDRTPWWRMATNHGGELETSFCRRPSVRLSTPTYSAQFPFIFLIFFQREYTAIRLQVCDTNKTCFVMMISKGEGRVSERLCCSTVEKTARTRIIRNYIIKVQPINRYRYRCVKTEKAKTVETTQRRDNNFVFLPAAHKRCQQTGINFFFFTFALFRRIDWYENRIAPKKKSM